MGAIGPAEFAEASTLGCRSLLPSPAPPTSFVKEPHRERCARQGIPSIDMVTLSKANA